MAARVCEPRAESIAPGEITRRASATCASRTSRTGWGKPVGDTGATTIGLTTFLGSTLATGCTTATGLCAAVFLADLLCHQSQPNPTNTASSRSRAKKSPPRLRRREDAFCRTGTAAIYPATTADPSFEFATNPTGSLRFKPIPAAASRCRRWRSGPPAAKAPPACHQTLPPARCPGCFA